MVNIHWNLIVFIIVVLAIIARLWYLDKIDGYKFSIEPLLWIIALISFILIWGGIFWW